MKNPYLNFELNLYRSLVGWREMVELYLDRRSMFQSVQFESTGSNIEDLTHQSIFLIAHDSWLCSKKRLQYNAALEEVTALKSDPWQEVISVNLLIHWTVALQ